MATKVQRDVAPLDSFAAVAAQLMKKQDAADDSLADASSDENTKGPAPSKYNPFAMLKAANTGPRANAKSREASAESAQRTRTPDLARPKTAQAYAGKGPAKIAPYNVRFKNQNDKSNFV